MADYISNYTGQEIDAAVGKASNLPNFAVADANKVLTVNSTGNGLKFTTPASGGGTDLSQISTGQVQASSYVLTLDDDTLTWSSIIPSWGCGEVDCVLTIADNDASGLAWTSRYPSYNIWGSDDHKVLALDYNTPDWAVAPVLFSNECANKVGQIPKLKQTINHGYDGDTYEYSFEWVNPDVLPSYNSNDSLISTDRYFIPTIDSKETVSGQWINGLPDYSSSYDGCVLTISSSGGACEAYWTDVFHYLTDYVYGYDEYEDNSGKVLTINDDDELEWISPSGGGVSLPAYSTDDAVGKTLQVQVAYIDNEANYYVEWSDSGLVPPSSVSGMGIVVQESGINNVVDPVSYIPYWLSEAWAGEYHLENANSFLAVVPSGDYSTSLEWVEGQIAPLATASDLGKFLTVISHTDEYDNTSYIPAWVTPNTPASIPSTVGCGEYIVLRDGSDDSFSLEESHNYILDKLSEINSVSFSNDSRYQLVLYTDSIGEATIQWERDTSYVPPQV